MGIGRRPRARRDRVEAVGQTLQIRACGLLDEDEVPSQSRSRCRRLVERSTQSAMSVLVSVSTDRGGAELVTDLQIWNAASGVGIR